jgi:ABC-type nitrate/sulfonate/bicarbonate transport system substrate-binding protein
MVTEQKAVHWKDRLEHMTLEAFLAEVQRAQREILKDPETRDAMCADAANNDEMYLWLCELNGHHDRYRAARKQRRVSDERRAIAHIAYRLMELADLGIVPYEKKGKDHFSFKA